MSSAILVVDDDREYREATVRHLRFLKYNVLEATRNDEALTCLKRHDVDLVVLEIALGAHSAIEPANNAPVPSGSNGLDLLELVRAWPVYIPVIVLTVLDRVDDETGSIRGGANVFLRKPVNTSLLTAYVRSQLRSGTLIRAALQARFSNSERNSPSAEEPCILHVNDLLIDTGQRTIRRGDGPYHHLSDREIRILAVLAKTPEKVFSKQELIRRAFGVNADVSEQAVEAIVKRLRGKIEPGPRNIQYIVNVRGMGYCFSGNESASETAARREVLQA
jgi:two-component system OmpR family response regulator